ncbi:MAG: trypsin-like peptidase domain-containing protein [Akkermansia sp.]|nr:trypsin-like peptidase domain-containing protein [Akkermansia sp.]
MKKKHLIAICAGLVLALLVIVTLLLVSGGTGSSGSGSMLERCKESVKLVIHFHQDGTPVNHGTCFVVNSAGSLVTNAHVVGTKSDNGETLLDPTPRDLFYIAYEKPLRNKKVVVMQRAYVEKMDASRDLAWLRVNTPDRAYLRPLAIARTATPGEEVKAMGFPAAYDSENDMAKLLTNMLIEHFKRSHNFLQDRVELEWNVGMGNLLSVVTQGGSVAQVRDNTAMNTGQSSDARMRVVVHNANVKGGMSGGPLVNEKGLVVGVNFGGHKNSEMINRAIDASELLHFLCPPGGDIESVAVVEKDPNSIIYRMRALLNSSSPREIVIVVLCTIVIIGAVSILFMTLLKGNKRRTRGVRSGPAITGRSNVYSPNPAAEDKTLPLPASDNSPTLPFEPVSGGKKPSLLFTGSDDAGRALRFRIPLSELQRKRYILIGRSSGTCAIQLPYKEVSRQQARIIYEEDAEGNVYLYIHDEQAKNTTHINGVPLRDRCQLMNGDELTFANITLKFTAEIS